MSRSLGLREDQREGRVLATLIFRLFPVDPVRCHRELGRFYRGSRVVTGFVCPPDQIVGVSLLAMRLVKSALI
jgi:hypothetical protein